MKPYQQSFDYIICGAGMAGLSLAYRICINPKLKNKSIAIIESKEKVKNDRTWAFWEKEDDIFENLIYKKWNKCSIKSHEGKNLAIQLGNYQYKVIRGIDFYNHTITFLKKQSNIVWINSHIDSIVEHETGVVVTTVQGEFFGKYSFDSTFQANFSDPKNHNLIQHFKGYIIETEQATFDDATAQIMNFDIEQKNECRFIYILPFSKTKALVEFTLFTEKLLDDKEYDFELKNYLNQNLSLKEYTITETEFGIIPMSDVPINTFIGNRIVRIGTSGGFTNPATGFTFKNTQKKLSQIIYELQTNDTPHYNESFFSKRFHLYASVLLNVLSYKRQKADEFFFDLYSKNSIDRLFKFLDGESTFFEELSIMYSTQKRIFSKAFFDVIRRKM